MKGNLPYTFTLDFAIGDVPCQIIRINPYVKPHSIYQIHRHVALELHHVREGKLTVVTEQRSYPVSAGQALLLPPPILHRVQYGDTPPLHASVLFRVGAPERSAGNPDLSRFADSFSLTSPRLLDAPPGGRLANTLEQLYPLERSCSESFIDLERVRSISALMLLALFEALTEQNGDWHPGGNLVPAPQDVRIMEFLSQHYRENNSGPRMAKHLNVSIRQLNRILMKSFGMSYRDLLKERRLTVASDLLTNTDDSIEKIAGLLGYSSASAFITAIRSATGKTPSQLRRELRGQSGDRPQIP